MGDFTSSNDALFKLLHGILSVTRASFVLMHAVSSDTHVIFVHTLAVYDSLDVSFDCLVEATVHTEFDDEEEFEAKLNAVDD
jgi:hypothetical protein